MLTVLLICESLLVEEEGSAESFQHARGGGGGRERESQSVSVCTNEPQQLQLQILAFTMIDLPLDLNQIISNHPLRATIYPLRTTTNFIL